MKVKDFITIVNSKIRIIIEPTKKHGFYTDAANTKLPADVLEAEVKCIDRVSECTDSAIVIKI